MDTIKHKFCFQFPPPSRKSYRLWDNVEKCSRAGQATDDNMAHANFLLDSYGYKYTHNLCNNHCFSTATMVVRRRFILTFYILCLYCLLSVVTCLSSTSYRGPERILLVTSCRDQDEFYVLVWEISQNCQHEPNITIYYYWGKARNFNAQTLRSVNGFICYGIDQIIWYLFDRASLI